MLSLKVRVRKGKRPKRSPRDRPGAVARAWAAEVERRVFIEGRPVGGRPGYVDHGGIRVAPGYASGGQALPNGAVYFANSGALRLRGGYASTSKGMRRGLIVRSHGGRAVVEFTGSSVGADPVWVNGQAVAQTVSNQDKASTVLDAHGVNVLAMTPRDLDTVRRVAAWWLRDQASRALGGLVRWRTSSRPTSRLGQRLTRER